ncbi:MAG: rhomboid family intramembrane serine protease [Chitinophagaceae bacterium]
MQHFSPGRFEVLPPIIKNLLIINVLAYLGQTTADLWGQGAWVSDFFALHNIQSSKFYPHQLVTHLFMHGDFFHLFFNMFALWMFGNVLENLWGPKRFLIFYFISGFGAAAMHMSVLSFEYSQLSKDIAMLQYLPTPERFSEFVEKYPRMLMLQFSADGAMGLSSKNIMSLLADWQNDPKNNNYIDLALSYARGFGDFSLNLPTVGASGAVFGALAAFGYLFPNTRIYIYFFFPLKAKWFVLLYAGAELWMGIRNSGGNVAHFAHLGGALIGFLLVYYWNKKDRQTFY